MKLLLGFLLKAEVDAIVKQNVFEIAQPNADPMKLWRASRDAVSRLPATPDPGEIRILEDGELSVIDRIRASRTYKKNYEGFADYQFAIVPIDVLLTPQPHADMDYIAELQQQISPDATLEEQFRFALPEGSITAPIVAGPQVIFTSHRKDLHADPIPSVREVGEGEFEIVVRAASRPNYIQIALVGNRLMLLNGVHKVCAMAKHGYTHVPCLLRQASRFEEAMNLQQTSLLRPELLGGARPAQLLDFLDDQLSVPALLRSRSQVLRIGVGVELFDVPALTPPAPRAQTTLDAPVNSTGLIPSAQPSA